ncbi:hypothetical protein ILUMI_26099 [Ignelater luminosus]|uniref:SAM domain-containing protein n=1 Tax=Ignelater luminosus TaxID=2038154 RepID=A0A8K0C971_IGNLU|nr:hypothetical protein ILUMI_26099 [Ignelater luminosus]
MDLFETVLRSANAERYIDILKEQNLEASTLPLLTDNDLLILGVDDEDIRKEILAKSSTLQIPHEKTVKIYVDKEFAELVLNQISHQLYLHHASLLCALNRKDIMVCDLKLHKASKCLLNCVTSLEKELDRSEKKFAPTKKWKPKKRRYLLVGLAVVSSSFALLLFGKLIKNGITK